MSTDSKDKIKLLIENAQYVCLFIVLIGLFIGTMYAHGASLFLSIPISFGLIFLMNYVIGILISLRKETRPSSSSFNMGKVPWWGIYILISLPISFYTIHMFNVEFGELENTRSIGSEKIKFISDCKAKSEAIINKHYENQGLALYTDYGKMLSGIITAETIAEKYNISADRVTNIIGNNEGEKMQDTKKAFDNQKGKLNKRIEPCFDLDINSTGKLAMHNFKQKEVIDALDTRLQLMKDSLEIIKADYSTIQLELPASSDIELELNKKSLIDQPLVLLRSNPFSSIVLVLIINLIILLPLFLSERRKAPPKSNKINTVTKH